MASRKRTVAIACIVVALAVLAACWQACGRSKRGAGARVTNERGLVGVERAARIDPRTQERAAISGTVTDERRAAVSGARVCAVGWSDTLPRSVTRESHCTVTDARGTYTIGGLYAASYVVSAMAKPYLPARSPAVRGEDEYLELTAGESRRGVDLVLREGGVELTGTVSDLTGGPVAHALVRAALGGLATETDEQGRFSLWVAPGPVDVTASAQGYTDGDEWGWAPGTLDLTLTPASSISGIVVDANSNAPVAGVAVDVSSNHRIDWVGPSGAITDEQGRFQIDGLTPDRYLVVAREPQRFGTSEGTVLVGLGQQVDGVVVKLSRVARLEGKVVIAGTPSHPCKEPFAWLVREGADDSLVGRGAPDGTVRVDSVLPGTYAVEVRCRGFVPLGTYPRVEVGDKDVVGLTWEVAEGGSVRGRVLKKTGEPVAGATVISIAAEGDAISKPDGSYMLAGVAPGKHRVWVTSDAGVAPLHGYEVEVVGRGVVKQDLLLDEPGAIRGIVVDTDGRPISGVRVFLVPVVPRSNLGGRTQGDGTFAIDKVPAGTYRLSVSVSPSVAGELPDVAAQETHVTVRGLEISTTRIVIEKQAGSISGRVVDAAGNPVTDAYVVAVRESSDSKAALEATRWREYDTSVITGVDGSFSLTELAAGTYTVRAFRKGGGEAIAAHVAIGATPTLQLRPTGSIEGTVRTSGGPPQELAVTVFEPTTRLTRAERFFRTNGAYSVRDLPAGRYQITCYVERRRAQTSTTLADGESKRAVDCDFSGAVTIRGRIIDLVTKQPLAGVSMSAASGDDGYSPYWYFGREPEVVTDAAGRFTIADVPAGRVTIRGHAPAPYSDVGLLRMISGPGDVDLGDIGIVKRRVERDAPVGNLGIAWAQFPDETPSDQRSFKVSAIDPAGPAARTKLQVGDVVTTIDGVDVMGANRSAGWNLLDVPPGTAVRLGLLRGIIVTVIAA